MRWWNEVQPSISVAYTRAAVLIDQDAEPGMIDNPGQVVVLPDAVPELIAHLREALYRLRGPDLSGLALRLPRDLAAALHESRPKRIRVKAAEDVYSTDTIELKPRRELTAENLRVRPQVSRWAGKGPHRGDGYYAVPAVNLVLGEAAHSLLWLPTERRYVTYDPEHTELMVFRPRLTWTRLRAGIERYFAATNSGGDVDPELAEYYRPWPAHPFVPTT